MKKNIVLSAAIALLSLTIAGCTDEPVAVTDVRLNKAATTLVAGDTEQLTATVLPADAENKAVAWSSNATAIASVDNNGLVTAVAAGAATITATTADGGFKAACVVTVEAAVIAVESVMLSEETLELTVGDESEPLTYTLLPEGATAVAVAWASDDTEVATVDNGVVTAVSEGTATITLTVDGKTDVCEVTVSLAAIPVESMTINRGAAVLKVGEQVTIIPVILPEEATNKNVTFESSNSAVATVNEEGVVSAVTEGSARIHVTTEDGNITKTCAITVSNSTTMNCSTGTPGWGESLGEVAFATAQTWPLGSLVWSDAVITSACNKEEFYGGAGTADYLSDCRTIPDYSSGTIQATYKGNYFSWCAVALHQDELCPNGWRVPTTDDFVALDKALGGEGTNQNNPQKTSPILPKYTADWGGEFSGWAMNTGQASAQNVDAHYWAANERDETRGYELSFKRSMFIGPLNYNAKTTGGVLRCVKDAE